jgi:ParB/RepB/Spo0J family partition protein
VAVTQQFADITLIDVDPDNPRGEVGDVTELAASMRVRGQEDPVQLIAKPGGRFWLHEGHRRRKAALQAGLTRLWYVEKTFTADRDRLLSQGVLHLHRVDFDPIAWANYLHRLYWDHAMTREAIAHHLGRSPNWVRDTVALYHLESEEKRAVAAGQLSKGEALWRLKNRRTRPGTTTVPVPATPACKPEPYFTDRHPLAHAVKKRCASSGAEHVGRIKIGKVGCGECWEDTIRDDARADARIGGALRAA